MRSLNKADESSYAILKKEIEETFGKKINSAGDCVLLSEEVYAKNSFKINSNTLRRFFGLVKSNYFPSATTLDILSKYCGFASFDEFRRLKNNTNTTIKEDYYSQSILNYLESIFKYTPVRDYHDKSFIILVECTIRFLHRHPELIDRFQRAISKTRNGQDFYFEQFIHIDGLNSFYGEGLRYYLMEKTTMEAQIFGHSLLCFKHWISEDAEGVKKHHDEVIKHRSSKVTSPFLCGLIFAVQLLYAENQGLPIEKILIKAQHAHASFKQKKDGNKFFHYFEYIISPVLLLTGHPQEALFYINYSLSYFLHKPSALEQSFYQSMNLVKAVTLLKIGKSSEAEKLYQKIQHTNFHPLTKKMDTILYLLLSQDLNKNNEKSDQQLRDLIKETGFIRLNNYNIGK